jgi:hypothetical protein
VARRVRANSGGSSEVALSCRIVHSGTGAGCRPAVRGNLLKPHRLRTYKTGNERYERASVIVHRTSNSLRNRSFLPSCSRCPAGETRRRNRRFASCHPPVRIDLPRYQKNSLNAGLRIEAVFISGCRRSAMASVATRSYSAALRCSILLTVLISNAECPEGNGPSWGRDLGGRVLGPSSPGDAIGGNASGIRNTRSQRSNGVCAVSDYKPGKSPLSTARNRTAALDV